MVFLFLVSNVNIRHFSEIRQRFYRKRPIVQTVCSSQFLSASKRLTCQKYNFSLVSAQTHVIYQSFLPHLVMSLCNHALSVMCHCCCRCWRHSHQCRWHWRLCTALPVTALIIQTSYLANICSYTPSICT